MCLELTPAEHVDTSLLLSNRGNRGDFPTGGAVCEPDARRGARADGRQVPLARLLRPQVSTRVPGAFGCHVDPTTVASRCTSECL